MQKQIFIFLLLIASVTWAKTYKKVSYRTNLGDSCATIVGKFTHDGLDESEKERIYLRIEAHNKKVDCKNLKPGKKLVLFLSSKEINYDEFRKYILSSERSTLGEHHVYAGLNTSISTYDFDVNSGLYQGVGSIKTTMEFGIAAGWNYHWKRKWKLFGDLTLRFSSLSDFENLELSKSVLLIKNIKGGGVYLLNPNMTINLNLGFRDVIGVTGLDASTLTLQTRMAPYLGATFNYTLYRYRDLSIITSLGSSLILGGDMDGISQEMGYTLSGRIRGTYPIDNLLGSSFFEWANNLFSLKKLFFAADVGYEMRMQNTELAEQSDMALGFLFSFNGIF